MKMKITLERLISNTKVVNLVLDRFTANELNNVKNFSILTTLPLRKLSSLVWRRNICDFNSANELKKNTSYSTSTSKMTSKPILYSYFRSSASWRVRIMLAHKGIDYEYKAVNLLKKEQLGDEYKKICPMGQVPVLKYDDKILTQSMAIMDFLEDLHPQVPMIPKDPYKKAKVREISDLINSGIQPLQNLSVLLKYNSEEPDKRIEWGNYWMSKGLEALETLLKESSGNYCVGDEITVADACLYPQAASASRFNVDLEKYPTINRIYKSLGEVEAFKKAHAFVQPDCPEDLRVAQKLQ